MVFFCSLFAEAKVGKSCTFFERKVEEKKEKKSSVFWATRAKGQRLKVVLLNGEVSTIEHLLRKAIIGP
jgi:hypothetical protein